MIVRIAELRINAEGVGAIRYTVQCIGFGYQAFEGCWQIGAAAVVVGGQWVIVVCEGVVTPRHFVRIAHPVLVHIRGAVSSANTRSIELIAIAVTVACWNIRTAAFVDRSWSVANAASIWSSHTTVYVITNPIVVSIRRTIATTDVNGIQLVAIAVTIPLRELGASALINLTWAVTDAASIEASNAAVDVITDAVAVGIGCAIATAVADGVNLVAIAIAVTCRDVRTAAVIDCTWSIADPASIETAYAVVDVITNAVVVGIG